MASNVRILTTLLNVAFFSRNVTMFPHRLNVMSTRSTHTLTNLAQRAIYRCLKYVKTLPLYFHEDLEPKNGLHVVLDGA